MEQKICPARILKICPFAGPGCSFEATKECPVYPEMKRKIEEGFSNGKWKEFCPILVFQGFSHCFCDIPSLKRKFGGKCWKERVEKRKKIMVCLPREKLSQQEILQALLKSK